jgi:hypothetical protein
MILEPTTTITDYMLAILGFVLGRRLLASAADSGQVAVRLWGMSFMSMALGAFVGGTSHGFADVLGPTLHAVLWKITVWSIGATAALLLAATAYSCLRSTSRRVLLGLAVGQLVLYAVWMIFNDDFIWVIADYLPAVIVVMALQLSAWRRQVAGAGWLLVGLATTLLGAGVQASGFALHEHFNHNDIYHVIQMAATVMLYRGAREARDRGGEER